MFMDIIPRYGNVRGTNILNFFNVFKIVIRTILIGKFECIHKLKSLLSFVLGLAGPVRKV